MKSEDDYSWQERYDKHRQCVEKQKYHSANKGLYSQGYCLLNGHVLLSELDRKKTEHQRIDAFKLRCWGILLRVPWTAGRSNQSILRKSILNIHWKDLCWSRSFNTLPTWCEELTLMSGKIEGRRRELQRMKWLDGITDTMDMNLAKLLEMVRDKEGGRAVVHGVTKSRTWLGDWTTTCVWMCVHRYSYVHTHTHTHNGILLSHKKWNLAIL